MRGPGTAVALALLLAALATAGCGLGPGDGVKDAELTVTRDYGTVPVLHRQLGDLTESDTVMRALERNAEITTRYGGGFVQSIEGWKRKRAPAARSTGSSTSTGWSRRSAPPTIRCTGASRSGGTTATGTGRCACRPWSAPGRSPFSAAMTASGERSRSNAWAAAALAPRCGERLEGAGVEISARPSSGAIRVLVGPWARLRSDPAAAQVERGPQASGVFADFHREGSGYRLAGLDEAGDAATEFGPESGLVAATRRYEEPPVWMVTGTSGAGVRAAAGLLDSGDLRDRYAAAVDGGKETPLPLR